MEENNKKQINLTNEEISKMTDATKYGEFVSSYFAWLTLEEQKDRAEELEDL